MDKWKRRICAIGVLLSVVSSSFALDVTISQPTYEVMRGEEVNIMCHFQPKNQVNRLIVITWTAEPDESFDDEGISFGTFYSDDGHVDINQMYEGKAEITSDVDARISQLILKQVTMRESRRIKCRVQIPGDDMGQTSATTLLVVLVAPSAPVCRIQGTAEYGYNLSLTCASDEGSPVPTYQWQSYDVRNVLRSFPPKTTEKDGVLSLFNVSSDTSGYYICTATNKIRSATCNLTLAVMPSTMKIGATAGIIGGCIAGIAVLVLIIYCCCRKKEKPEEFAMGPPVIEYHDTSEKDEKEEDPLDLRRASIEGGIDQREKNELKAEKTSNLRGSEDSDRNSNRRFNVGDDQERTADCREDERRERDEDHRGHYGDRQDRYDDRRDHYDARQDNRDRYDDRYNDRRDRFDDHQYRYDDRRDRYDDRYDDRRDRYDDRQDRYEDRRYHHHNEHQDHYDDRRGHYDDRQGRYDDHRDRYDDRHDDYDDHKNRHRG
ncbi:cell surface A33 antigen [Pygocentrus nattereri]|nr:cell surface A33 antigen [Pygocentrus nattereri]